MIQSRAYLKTKFETGDTPTEQDFTDLIDTFLHGIEDVPLLGLSEYNPVRTYATGESTIKDRVIYQALRPTTGTFKPVDWQATGEEDNSEFDMYDPAEVVAAGQYREFDGKIYKCLVNGTSGITPGTDPIRWAEVAKNDGKFGNYWKQGFYDYEDVVRWYDASLGKLRLLECTVEGFESTALDTEIGENKWRDVGGGQSLANADEGLYTPTVPQDAVANDITLQQNKATFRHVFDKILAKLKVLIISGAGDKALFNDGTYKSITSDPLMGGDLSGNASTAQIKASAVTTSKINNNAVTSDKLASDANLDLNRAVGSNHLKNNSVIDRIIVAKAVLFSKIQDIPQDTAMARITPGAGSPESVPLVVQNLSSLPVTYIETDGTVIAPGIRGQLYGDETYEHACVFANQWKKKRWEHTYRKNLTLASTQLVASDFGRTVAFTSTTEAQTAYLPLSSELIGCDTIQIGDESGVSDTFLKTIAVKAGSSDLIFLAGDPVGRSSLTLVGIYNNYTLSSNGAGKFFLK